jgi:hypothetical protein
LSSVGSATALLYRSIAVSLNLQSALITSFCICISLLTTSTFSLTTFTLVTTFCCMTVLTLPLLTSASATFNSSSFTLASHFSSTVLPPIYQTLITAVRIDNT